MHMGILILAVSLCGGMIIGAWLMREEFRAQSLEEVSEARLQAELLRLQLDHAQRIINSQDAELRRKAA